MYYWRRLLSYHSLRTEARVLIAVPGGAAIGPPQVWGHAMGAPGAVCGAGGGPQGGGARGAAVMHQAGPGGTGGVGGIGGVVVPVLRDPDPLAVGPVHLVVTELSNL